MVIVLHCFVFPHLSVMGQVSVASLHNYSDVLGATALQEGLLGGKSVNEILIFPSPI